MVEFLTALSVLKQAVMFCFVVPVIAVQFKKDCENIRDNEYIKILFSPDDLEYTDTLDTDSLTPPVTDADVLLFSDDLSESDTEILNGYPSTDSDISTDLYLIDETTYSAINTVMLHALVDGEERVVRLEVRPSIEEGTPDCIVWNIPIFEGVYQISVLDSSSALVFDFQLKPKAYIKGVTRNSGLYFRLKYELE